MCLDLVSELVKGFLKCHQSLTRKDEWEVKAEAGNASVSGTLFQMFQQASPWCLIYPEPSFASLSVHKLISIELAL